MADGGLLTLRQADDWIDYRALSIADRSDEGVAIDDPITEATAFEILTTLGEGPSIEYKQVLPTKDTLRKVLKTVSAYANGEGGTIVFGVEDDGTRRGLDQTFEHARDLLTNWIRSFVLPPPQFRLESFRDNDGRLFVLLEVEPGGAERPFAVVLQRDRPEHFVRRGASSFLAQPSELRAMR